MTGKCDDNANLIRSMAKTHGLSDIANKVGVKKQAIWQWMRKNNVEGRTKKEAGEMRSSSPKTSGAIGSRGANYSSDVKREVVRLKGQMKAAKVAEQCGIRSTAAVYQIWYKAEHEGEKYLSK